jgi:hypothetical protein
VTPRTAILGLAGLLLAYWIGSWLYREAPWHSRDLLQAIASGPHSAPWSDATEKVAGFFPIGMDRESAAGLLKANGFSCTTTAPPEVRGFHAIVTEVQGGLAEVPRSPNAANDVAEVLACGRASQEGVCQTRYSVAVYLARDQRVADRAASYYFACP